ncbi:hypothetical protein ACEQ8H_004256 [Pleosporales sp. CAS-2024a]
MSSTAASSVTTPLPQPSALPPQSDASRSQPNTAPDTTTAEASAPDFAVAAQRKPLLRLEIRDLSSSGSRAFLRLVHASHALQDALDTVLTLLYSKMHPSCIPPTRSVTLVLRDMEGVAYTTGLDMDGDHKEIHFSTNYIASVPELRPREKIMGVLIHEMVHCWQHDGFGKAPGGLIEGVADWVRLKANYAPPHWKKDTDCDWDAGYQKTAYFLEWLEGEYGHDVVRKINDAMRGCEYDAEKVWHGCCGGKGVEELWQKYKKSIGGSDEGKKEDAKKETSNKGKEMHVEATCVNGSAQDQDQPTHKQNRVAELYKARRAGDMHISPRPSIE